MAELELRHDGYIHVSTNGPNDIKVTKVKWRGFFPPLYLRISEYARLCNPGEMLPPWYYWFTYQCDYGREAVFHLIPICIIVRFLRYCHITYCRIQTRQSWFDKEIARAYDRGFKRGFDNGYVSHFRKKE